MKLTPRFTLAFILYAIALLVSVGMLAYQGGRATLRASVISELEGTATRKETNLNNWIITKEELIAALAADPAVMETASTLTTTEPASGEYRIAQDLFASTAGSRLETSEFLEASLVDLETGEVHASTSPVEVGTFKNDRQYFLSGRNGTFVENPNYSEASESMVMMAATPVRGTQGGPSAVLIARLDLESLSAVIGRRTNVHETDDAYLVNASYLFVTQPRFLSDPAALRQEVHTESVDHCVAQESGVLETIDYRNVPAIVVYRWVPERQVCLLMKIDQAEAYAPVRAFGGRIVAISVIALLAAAAIAVALARTMTRPILALQEGVSHFAQGSLDRRLDESARDELGELAGEFNRMADALVEQQTHLRRRAEEFFNLTPDLLCTVDISGRLVDVNPAWEKTLGYRLDDLRGQLFTNLVHPDDLEELTNAFQQVRNRKNAHFEARCRHKDEKYRWLAWEMMLSPQDGLLYAAARDSTERRAGEEKLRYQAEELERSNRDLEQFAFIASHDLQEPLRLVTSNVQLLARRYEGRLDQDADEFIRFAVEAVERMKHLIGDLLTYARVGAQKKMPAPVVLEEVFKRVAEALKPVIVNADAVVTHDPLPAVLGDDIQMAQLFHALIENAIKFRSADMPRVHVGVRHLGERLLFFVQDNGIGIDPLYTERVFTLFQRLHNQEQYPGRGVGLAISRKIVERHGGRIWVDSEPGRGATFYFTLEPAERWTPVLPTEVVKPRTKDTVVDRAKDLI